MLCVLVDLQFFYEASLCSISSETMQLQTSSLTRCSVLHFLLESSELQDSDQCYFKDTKGLPHPNLRKLRTTIVTTIRQKETAPNRAAGVGEEHLVSSRRRACSTSRSNRNDCGVDDEHALPSEGDEPRHRSDVHPKSQLTTIFK